jgi:hypothetical protein
MGRRADGTHMSEQIQVHLVHPYNVEIRQNRQVSDMLERGFRIVDLQRVTDREVVVTLEHGRVEAD